MKKLITRMGLWSRIFLFCFIGITFNSKGLAAAKKTPYENIYYALLQIGKSSHEGIFNLSEQLTKNPLIMKQKQEEEWFFTKSTQIVEITLESVIKFIYELNPNPKENDLKKLGLVSTNDNSDLEYNRKIFKEQFFFLAINTLPLLSLETFNMLVQSLLDFLREYFFLVLDGLKAIEDAEDNNSGKGKFEKEMKDLLTRIIWEQVYDFSFNKETSQLLKKFDIFNAIGKDKIKKAAIGTKHTKSSIETTIYLISLILNLTDPKNIDLTDPKNIIPSSQFSPLDKELFPEVEKLLQSDLDQIKLLILLSDFKIDGGKRLRTAWLDVTRLIVKLCNKFKTKENQKHLARDIFFIAVESLGIGLFFPAPDPTSKLKPEFISLEDWRNRFFTDEAFSICLDAKTAIFSQKKQLPSENEQLNQLNKFVNALVSKVYDPNNLEQKKVIEDFFRALIKFLESQISLMQLVDLTHIFGSLSNAWQYIQFYSKFFHVLLKLYLEKGVRSAVKILVETSVSLGEEKDPDTGKTKIHPFDIVLKKFKNTSEETIKLLENSTVPTEFSPQKKQEMILSIKSELICEKIISGHWELMKKNIGLLCKLFNWLLKLEQESDQNKREGLKDEVKQCIAEIMAFWTEEGPSFQQKFTEAEKEIQDNRVKRFMLSSFSNATTHPKTPAGMVLKKLENEIKKIKESKKTNEKKEEDIGRAIANYREEIFRENLETSIINDDLTRLDDPRGESLQSIVQGMITMKKQEQNTKKFVDNFPNEKARQSIAANGKNPYPITEHSTTIQLRSEYNDHSTNNAAN